MDESFTWAESFAVVGCTVLILAFLAWIAYLESKNGTD